MPTFNMTPDKIALTAEGAFECASGSQEWKGKIPDFAANPINKNTKLAISILGDKMAAFAISTVQLSVPLPRTSPESVYKKISPINEKSMAPDAMNMYLRAASIFSLADRIATSAAEKTVVSSAKIQKRARLSEMNAKVVIVRRRLKAI